jgi:GNAT superfamily N-acetyltransferase
MAPFRIEPLAKVHDRSCFDCGVPELNDYFQRRASQDVRRRIAACFVAVEIATLEVAGFYTISAGSIALRDLPEPTARKLPHYPVVPIARVARLAVDRRYQGQKLGAALLFDALKVALDSGIAMFSLVVDAKDEEATRFYTHFGFSPLTNQPRTLFLKLDAGVKRLASP